MANLTEIIKTARPKSADSSIKAYNRLLNKMILSHPMLVDDYNSMDWVKDTEFNYKTILGFGKGGEAPSDSTIRNYLVALMIYIEGINGGKANEGEWSNYEYYKFYENKVTELNDKLKKDKEANGLTTAQSEQFMDYKEFDKILDSMKKMAHKLMPKPSMGEGDNMKKQALETENYKYIMTYVLLKIYQELNIRNEIATLIYITKRDYNKLKKQKQANKNYIINEKSKITIIRNQYKTSEVHKTIELQVSKNLTTLLRKWIAIDNLKSGDLFFKKLQPNEEAITSTPELNLTKFLQRQSEKYFNKKLSTTILAKIYMSRPENQTAQGLINASNVRGTALNTLVPTYANSNN
jgi:hypothetical protein